MRIVSLQEKEERKGIHSEISMCVANQKREKKRGFVMSEKKIKEMLLRQLSFFPGLEKNIDCLLKVLTPGEIDI
jgi:hypothetical protein